MRSMSVIWEWQRQRTKPFFSGAKLKAGHMLLAASAASQPSVIRIREEGMKAADIVALVLAIHRHWAQVLDEGCVMVFARGSVRFRRLPIRT